MRGQDEALQSLKRQRKDVQKVIRQAERNLRKTKAKLADSQERVAIVTERLGRALAQVQEGQEAGPDAGESLDEKLDGLRADLERAKRLQRQLDAQIGRILNSRHAARRRLPGLRRSIKVVIGRREAAEGGLAAYIVNMTHLAQARAERQTDVRLSHDGAAFGWPARGRIVQRYGCTGFYVNPPRGSCPHFHDGLDIAPDRGTKVRAAAAGVVAFVGWNPWDTSDRAFIAVLGHPDGFVSRYGHLQPLERVRVGQLVREGQVIGRMGNTGRAIGVHLHLELLHNDSIQDPKAFFPSRRGRPTDGDRPDETNGGVLPIEMSLGTDAPSCGDDLTALQAAIGDGRPQSVAELVAVLTSLVDPDCRAATTDAAEGMALTGPAAPPR